MTDEAIEKAWREYAGIDHTHATGRVCFTAGYLAAQRAAVGEREHLEEAAAALRSGGTGNRAAWIRKDSEMQEAERLRRERQPKEDTHG